MTLMTFVRLLVLLVIGWTVLALGAGVLGVGAHDSAGSTFYLARPSLHDALSLSRLEDPGDGQYRLLDQTNGQVKALKLPGREDWSLLSVSPWRDKDGNLEAAGRWVCRGEGDGEFCGIGYLTIADSTVKKRVALDVLPTGKPCWIYGRPGEFLFPAGNRQLYRCNIAGRADENARDKIGRDPDKNEVSVLKTRAVAWETEIPGSAVAFLGDPAVSSQRLMGRLVFVSLSLHDSHAGRRVIRPYKLWWLVMNDEGNAIVNAGQLTEPGPKEPENDTIFERFPSVVTGADGESSLVYLTRTLGQNSWQLRSAKLEIDAVTALPRIEAASGSHALARDLAPSPLVVSTNGDYVFASNVSGQIVKHPIPR